MYLFCVSPCLTGSLAFISRFYYGCSYKGKVYNFCVSWTGDGETWGVGALVISNSSHVEAETAVIIVISKELCLKVWKKD